MIAIENQKLQATFQYLISLILTIPCFIIVILTTFVGLLTWGPFLEVANMPTNSLFIFLFGILEFIYFYWYLIIPAIIISVVTFEWKYRLHNKYYIRLGCLIGSALLVIIFTICYLFSMIQLLNTAIHSDTIRKIVNDERSRE